MFNIFFESRLKFDSAEECSKWYERLKKKCVTPDRLEQLFAFAYYAWCQDTVPDSPASDHNGLNGFQLRGKKSLCVCDFLEYHCAFQGNRMIHVCELFERNCIQTRAIVVVS